MTGFMLVLCLVGAPVLSGMAMVVLEWALSGEPEQDNIAEQRGSGRKRW